MAYLDLREAELSGSISTARYHAPTDQPVEPTGFSTQEWLVIALAEQDGLSSLNEPGRIAVALSRLFGNQAVPRLANPRLEALRRLAVTAWHYGHQVPPSGLAAFHAAGFSTGQAETLLDAVTTERAIHRRRRSGRRG
jgi:hypothetical protein